MERTGLADSAFAELIEPYRRELHLHCYRIVGSLADADDLVQETLLAAWRGFAEFEGRSSVRAWLYKIATNRSLNLVRDSARRPQRAEPSWLQPYPDDLLDRALGTPPEPGTRYEAREAVGLAFITLLQRLPARQRAALVLCDVLGFRLDETAQIVGGTPIAVKSMLQRARARLDAGQNISATVSSARERELAGLFATALEAGDTTALVSLLTDDAWLTMPPEPYAYQGLSAIAGFLRERLERGWAGLHTHTLATRANGQPAIAYYHRATDATVARARGLMVLTVSGCGIEAVTRFGDTSLFGHFGLPLTIDIP